MPVAFRAETERLDGDVSAVQVYGELDQATVPQLTRALDSVIDEGTGALLVDLTDCSFIDSSGLAALVTARERVIADDTRQFGLCCPDSQVRRLLEVTGLDEAMGVVATRDDALEVLRA